MSSRMKNIALCLISVLATLAAVTYFSEGSSSNNQQLEAQGYYEEQNRIYMEQIEKAREHSKRLDLQLDQSEKNQKRYDALLTRWELQADRMDKLLENLATK
jgi:hypothetical protein